MAIRSFFLRFISVFIAVLALLTWVGVCGHDAWDVYDPQTCRLHFSIVSDVHTEGNNAMRYKVLARTMQDMKKCKSGNDAILFLGDNTMNGFRGENILFHGIVRAVLRGENVLTVLGNHDVSNDENNKKLNDYLLFTNAFFGKQLDRPCYTEQINGYTFIILGLDVQLDWLQDALDAANGDKPVFIFAHLPLQRAQMQGDSDTDSLSAMLARYGAQHEVFCFVGHTHMDLSLSRSFRSGDGYTQIYMPCLTELIGERDNEPTERTGDGVEVEVYDDELVIRGRNFFRGEWIGSDEGETLLEVRYPLAGTDAAIGG